VSQLCPASLGRGQAGDARDAPGVTSRWCGGVQYWLRASLRRRTDMPRRGPQLPAAPERGGEGRGRRVLNQHHHHSPTAPAHSRPTQTRATNTLPSPSSSGACLSSIPSGGGGKAARPDSAIPHRYTYTRDTGAVAGQRWSAACGHLLWCLTGGRGARSTSRIGRTGPVLQPAAAVESTPHPSHLRRTSLVSGPVLPRASGRLCWAS
jgi:hypothetical protein